MDAYRVTAIDGTQLGPPFFAMSIEDACVVLHSRAERFCAPADCPFRLDVLVESAPDYWADTELRAAS